MWGLFAYRFCGFTLWVPFWDFFFPLNVCYVGSLNLGPMTPVSPKTPAFCLSSTPPPSCWFGSAPMGGKMWLSHVLSFFQRLCSFLFLPAFDWSPVFLNSWFLIYCPEFIIVIVRRLSLIQVFHHIQQRIPLVSFNLEQPPPLFLNPITMTFWRVLAHLIKVLQSGYLSDCFLRVMFNCSSIVCISCKLKFRLTWLDSG